MNNERKEMLQTSIVELMQNEDFFEKLADCKTIEETQKCLTDAGVSITLGEVKEFTEFGTETLKNYSSDELSAKDLDEVAGGGWLRQTGRFLASAAGGAVLGFACGVCPALTPAIYPYVAVTTLWVAQG